MAALRSSVSRWGALLVPGSRQLRLVRRRPIELLHPQKEEAAAAAAGRPATEKPDPAPREQPGRPFGPSLLDGLSYEKAFPGDKRLAKVVTLAKSKKFREQHGKILVEGRRLITDALGAGALLQTLFFSTVESLRELPLEKLKHVKLIKVKFEEIKMWSDLVTPQGAIGIFVRPDHSKMKYPAIQQEHTVPLFLIGDNIRDPGNLGTILRSAVAAGCGKVLLTKGCVDVWEPKVLRAGMGAHFRIPVISNLEWEVIPNYLSSSTRVLVADPSHGGTDHTVTPPELGAAGDRSWRQVEYQESDSEDEEGEFLLPLPKVGAWCYSQPWAQEQTAIVIGGETHGLSLEALLLAEKTGGQRLYIPMVPAVDSLNSAMAASVLLFEGRRQLLSMVPATNRTDRPNSSVA
ncbi:rRNA methyltransferase 3A, mitochondrial [Chiloscyllium plagiosum]|uniref:rRNA methyltransferase 3A, mitochondrial n=1 Tax=Chiloscyllium plagiosum TaxID=36176 RepID=UPI001CB8831F|nr:rRNA methyltransferase 3A, mitochondrial [Chiloscyllium plagiosum]